MVLSFDPKDNVADMQMMADSIGVKSDPRLDFWHRFSLRHPAAGGSEWLLVSMGLIDSAV